MPYADKTTLNNLSPNLQPQQVAASGLRLAAFQYLYSLSDANYAEMQNLVTSGTLSPLPPDFMYRQGIINAGMGVAQRVGDLGSKTLATGTSAYAVDRIKSFNNGSGVNATVSQVAVSDLDGAGMGLQIVHAAAPSTGGKLAHSYTLEARDAYKWAGLPCVKALKVKAVGGMDKVTINARYKTSESAVDSASTLILSTGPIAINNLSWQVIPLTVATLPIRATLTNTGVIGFEIVFSKSTSEASGDGGIITELELIKGGTDLGFQPKSIADELQLCQRYYRTFGIGIMGVATSTTAFVLSVLTTGMRTIPTVVLKTASFSLFDGSTNVSTTTGTLSVAGVSSTGITLNGGGITGLTALRTVILNTADVFGLDSEL